MKLCKNFKKFTPGRYGLLILLVIYLNGFSKLKSQEFGPVSFTECINKAKKYHPFSKDKQTIDATRLAKLNNISVSWLPQLSLNAQATYQSEATKISVPIPGVNISGTPLDQYKLNLDVNQMIYDGGSLSAQKKLTEAGIEAELQQNETDIYKISDQVSNVFFYSLLLQINRDVYKNTLEDLDSKEKKITSGLRNGILMESDLNSIRVEILKTRQMLSELEMAFANSIGVLVELTGDSS
ncbi:MAG: TolC family protein, partial [Bacteroidales bacterium]|nr:TolC family protein [Bacteroidales bacterium]